MAGAGSLWLAALLLIAACAPQNPPPAGTVTPGTVELNHGPPKDTLLGGGGIGTVAFNGQALPFAIGGVGVEGAAIAVLQTSGEVYRLNNIDSFPGTYRRAPADAIPASQGASGLWLRNERGTLLYLQTPSGGRMPDIGTDAVRIVLGQ